MDGARRFLTPEGEPRAFIIISSARSGSNLLVGYLRQVREAACFGEIFRGDFPGKPGWDGLVARLGLPGAARTLHADDLTAFWELVLEHGLRRRRWLGAKAFYYHRRRDALWERFGELDHLVIHLWRDATLDQYVSRLLAVASGEWKERSGGRGADTTEGGEQGPRVTFDRTDYLRYRGDLRADIEAARARYGGSGRYLDVEYRQLLDHAHVAWLIERLFGEQIDVAETLRRQRPRPKIEYLTNPEAAEPFSADSIEGGFASE